MQLRKVCSHPFLFDWPIDSATGTNIINDQLIRASGKMLVLERLLDELFKRGHRVLIFSQFTTMLDIIEDWAVEFKGWKLCRIDGSTKPMSRRDEMKRFQESNDNDPDAPKLFLLSTRAGGLGINLTKADTVIFYDQDWVCGYFVCCVTWLSEAKLSRTLKWTCKLRTEHIGLVKRSQCSSSD